MLLSGNPIRLRIWPRADDHLVYCTEAHPLHTGGEAATTRPFIDTVSGGHEGQ